MFSWNQQVQHRFSTSNPYTPITVYYVFGCTTIDQIWAPFSDRKPFQKPDNTQTCHQSSIQPPLLRFSSELLVVKLVPPLPSPQRSVHSVSPQRRSVTISARPLVTGRVSRLPSSWPSRTVRLRLVRFQSSFFHLDFPSSFGIDSRTVANASRRDVAPAKEVVLTCRVETFSDWFITP